MPRVALHGKHSSAPFTLQSLQSIIANPNYQTAKKKTKEISKQNNVESPSSSRRSNSEWHIAPRDSHRFHFYGYDMTRQVEAHHFCAHQNEEMRQCLIFDSPEKDAKLIGLEYILPDEEKPLWHSHLFEVKSGVLCMPRIPGPIERQDLDKVCKTYGKTIYFWQVDKGDNLLLGLPQVMMALTRDGQLYDELARVVEKRYGVSFEEVRKKRADLTGPVQEIHPLANGGGKGLKTKVREVDCKPIDSVPRVFV